jgi:outer membrane protein TolC
MASKQHRRAGVLVTAVTACLIASVSTPQLLAQSGQHLPDAAPGAAPVRRLTLEEARQLAVQNNQSLALARINVDSKAHATAAAKKDYFPKLMGSVSYFHFNDDLGSVVTFQRGALGILPPGSRVIEANVLNQDSTLSTIFLAQPITKLIAVHALTQIARADEFSAQAQLDKGTREVLSGVTQAYEGLLGAMRIQAALELQLRLLEELAAAKPSPGLKVAVLETRQGLVQVRGQVRELNQTLDDLLDLPPCTILELVDPVPVELAIRCEEEAVHAALAHNPEIRDAEQNIAKAEAAMQVAKMAFIPDVNIIGGYANQTAASYIQPNIGYVGLTGSYTFWEWGKKRDVKRQRDADIALAHQNVRVVTDKVQLETRKAFGEYEQAREEWHLAGELAKARKEAEKAATSAAAAFQAKSDTTKAELEAMKAEITYRVAHAKLSGMICPN